MFLFLNKTSKSRKYWIILILSATGLISITFFMQHFLIFKPCILCIYQRCVLFGIIIAGIIALISPNTLLRYISIFIWIYSSFKGLFLAKKNINMVLHPSPFYMCDVYVTFPNWLPLHKWWPSMFDTDRSSCFDYKWYFLSFEMSQWMFLIFTIYSILAICTMIAQFTYLKKYNV